MLNCHELRVVQSDPVKILTIQGFPRTETRFQDIQGLENEIFNFKAFLGFQGPVCTLLYAVRTQDSSNRFHKADENSPRS